MIVLLLLLLLVSPAWGATYSSTFSGSENPLSEAGTWIGLGSFPRPQKISGDAAAMQRGSQLYPKVKLPARTPVNWASRAT